MDYDVGRPITDQWIMGWKVANLVMSNLTHQASFLPVLNLALVQPYGADATARCNTHPWHRPPHVELDPRYYCYCGFNAFRQRGDAITYMHSHWGDPLHTSSLVLLRVALAGRVIEGHHSDDGIEGFRAQRQVVTDVFLPDRCYHCSCQLGGTMEGHLMPVSEGHLVDFPGYTAMVPMCHRHTLMPSVSINEFAMMADTPPLHWASDVPSAFEITWEIPENPLAEYVLSDADVQLLRRLASHTRTSYRYVLDNVLKPSRISEARPGFGTALLTAPDRHRKLDVHPRRQLDLSQVALRW